MQEIAKEMQNEFKQGEDVVEISKIDKEMEEEFKQGEDVLES